MADHADEPTVYKQLSTDMRQGLKDIYQQISTASSDQASPVPETDALFHEASDQLGEVLKATETATMSIMEIVEKHLDLQAESAELLAADSGLGFLITMGGRVARPDLIVLGMICVGVSGAIIGIIIDYIEKRLLAGIRR